MERKSFKEWVAELPAIIMDRVVNDGMYKVSTCDTASYGWDPQLHEAMNYFMNKGIPGLWISRKYKFEVYDWVVIPNGTIDFFNTDPPGVFAAAKDLLYACEEHIKHIDSLPDDTEKCRILKMSLNNRSGELIRLAVKLARGK